MTIDTKDYGPPDGVVIQSGQPRSTVSLALTCSNLTRALAAPVRMLDANIPFPYSFLFGRLCLRAVHPFLKSGFDLARYLRCEPDQCQPKRQD
jgi:hypothetical protein